jgi:hypothetical protein
VREREEKKSIKKQKRLARKKKAQIRAFTSFPLDARFQTQRPKPLGRGKNNALG